MKEFCYRNKFFLYTYLENYCSLIHFTTRNYIRIWFFGSNIYFIQKMLWIDYIVCAQIFVVIIWCQQQHVINGIRIQTKIIISYYFLIYNIICDTYMLLKIVREKNPWKNSIIIISNDVEQSFIIYQQHSFQIYQILVEPWDLEADRSYILRLE